MKPDKTNREATGDVDNCSQSGSNSWRVASTSWALTLSASIAANCWRSSGNRLLRCDTRSCSSARRRVAMSPEDPPLPATETISFISWRSPGGPCRCPSSRDLYAPSPSVVARRVVVGPRAAWWDCAQCLAVVLPQRSPARAPTRIASRIVFSPAGGPSRTRSNDRAVPSCWRRCESCRRRNCRTVPIL